MAVMKPYFRYAFLAIFPAIAVIVVLGSLFGGKSGVVQLRRIQDDARKVDQQIVAQAAENARLANEVARLRDDPATLDRAIAEDLQLVPAGSTVYRFQPVHATPASIPAEDGAPGL